MSASRRHAFVFLLDKQGIMETCAPENNASCSFENEQTQMMDYASAKLGVNKG